MVKTGATSKSSVDWSSIPADLIPSADDTHDLGAEDKRWKTLYAFLAVLASLTIGGIYIGATAGGDLYINASTQINGSLNVTENITADYFIGDGSGLTGVAGANDTNWNITGSQYLFDDSGILDVNQTELNRTIDARDSTIGNCSVTGSCSNILYGANSTDFMAAGTDNWVNITGDTMSGQLNIGANINSSENITILQDNRFCLDGATCTKYIYYNGTNVIIHG